jgi:hypothetical protein|uniref:Uncharacterized protein n=1 Tax=Mesoaciditoga lauensis TaxID=1495039 RepID=A0A7V3RDJ3_9BACT
MLKIYMGSILASTEFTKFDLGITSDTTLSLIGRWLRVKENGAIFDDSGFTIAQRPWRVPVTIDEVIFDTPVIRIGILYDRELRMIKLLKALKEYNVDLIVGYLKSENYNPYELIASGWGCAQTIGSPVVIVNFTPETLCYSLFFKMDETNDGIVSLSEKYTMVSIPVEKKEITGNKKEQYKGK